jgi:hypothetical protein
MAMEVSNEPREEGAKFYAPSDRNHANVKCYGKILLT